MLSSQDPPSAVFGNIVTLIIIVQVDRTIFDGFPELQNFGMLNVEANVTSVYKLKKPVTSPVRLPLS